MPWNVEFDDLFEDEFEALAEDVQDALLAVAKLLMEQSAVAVRTKSRRRAAAAS